MEDSKGERVQIEYDGVRASFNEESQEWGSKSSHFAKILNEMLAMELDRSGYEPCVPLFALEVAKKQFPKLKVISTIKPEYVKGRVY